MAEPTSKKYVDEIKSRLTELAANIALSGRLNLTDIHVASEDFYAGLLNIVYGWTLKNANIDHPNAEGIDLVDDNEKVLVQVSADCSKRKIEHSLEEIDEAFRGYHFFFLPLITTKAESQKRQTYFPPHDVVFNPQKDIIEIVDLVRALQADTTGRRLEEAYQYIKANLSRSIEERPLQTDYSKLKAHLSEQLRITREGHPSFKLMEIDKDLFPDGMPQLHLVGAAWETKEIKPIQEILEDSWNRAKNHLIIEGEGGIGKTVTLLSIPFAFVPHEVPAIYISLSDLDANEKIDDYIKTWVFLKDDKLYSDFCSLSRQPWNNGPRVLLLLDGFNEVAPQKRKDIGKDIAKWANNWPGIQIITTSRSDVCSFVHIRDNYYKIPLQPLKQDTVNDYLKRWGLPTPNKRQLGILSLPLMLTLYAQTEKAINPIDNDTRGFQLYRRSNSEGSIIWNYLQREIGRYLEDINDVVKCVLSTELVAPQIAWHMQKDSVSSLDEQLFWQYIDDAYEAIIDLDKKNLPLHIQRVLRKSKIDLPSKEELLCFIEDELRLFIRKDESYSLMHQQFRDALAAIHLINVTYRSSELPNEWKTPIDPYVMSFVADIASKEEADRVWEQNRRDPSKSDVATINMLELQKRKRKYNFSDLDFSDLDLCNISLFPYKDPNSMVLRIPHDCSLNKGMSVSEKTFFPEGHSGGITAIAITDDGKRCVSGSIDKSLRVWDINTGEIIQLKGHQDKITAVAITPDGKRCASLSSDYTLRVWDIDSKTCLDCLDFYPRFERIAMTSKGDRVIAVQASSIFVWNIGSSEKDKSYYISVPSLMHFAAFPDANKCVCVSGITDPKFLRLDLESGKSEELFRPKGKLHVIAISDDGKRCLCHYAGNTLAVFDFETGFFKELRGSEKLYAFPIAFNGNKVITLSTQRNSVILWDLESDVYKDYKGLAEDIKILSFTPNGEKCVCGSVEGSLFLLDFKTGSYKKFQGHIDTISALAISTNGERLVSGSMDCSLRVWDLEVESLYGELIGYNSSIETLNVTPNGERLICGLSSGVFYVWDLDSKTVKRILSEFGRVIGPVAVSTDGEILHVGYRNGTLCNWAIETGELKKNKHPKGLSAIVFSQDVKKCAVLFSDNLISILNMETADSKVITKTDSSSVIKLAMDMGGNKLAAVLVDGIKVWDLATGDSRFYHRELDTLIQDVVFTKSGEQLVVLYMGGFVFLWDFESNESTSLETNNVATTPLSCTSDGKKCICGNSSGTLSVWDLKARDYYELYGLTKDELSVIKNQRRKLVFGDGSICVSSNRTNEKGESFSHEPTVSLAFYHNEQKCVSACSDGTLSFWDLELGSFKQLQGTANRINAIAPYNSPSHENKCLCAIADGTILIWNLDSCLTEQISVLPLSIIGVDLSLSIVPPNLKETLRQNGAIV